MEAENIEIESPKPIRMPTYCQEVFGDLSGR